MILIPELKVGDRIIRVNGACTGEKGTVVHIKDGLKNNGDYTVGIRFDNVTVWADRIYNGHASYCALLSKYIPEDPESIEV